MTNTAEQLREMLDHNYRTTAGAQGDVRTAAAAALEARRELAEAREIMAAAESALSQAAKGYTPTIIDTNGYSKTAARIRRWLAATAGECECSFCEQGGTLPVTVRERDDE